MNVANSSELVDILSSATAAFTKFNRWKPQSKNDVFWNLYRFSTCSIVHSEALIDGNIKDANKSALADIRSKAEVEELLILSQYIIFRYLVLKANKVQ